MQRFAINEHAVNFARNKDGISVFYEDGHSEQWQRRDGRIVSIVSTDQQQQQQQDDSDDSSDNKYVVHFTTIDCK